MGSIYNFISNFNWQKLIVTLMSVAASLLCLTVHELCHGLAAYKLGDPTAKRMGRLTLNPIKHIDILGLILMVTVRVGWAKPVPVDMRYFKRPKRDMALTALAGPASNFVLAWVFLLLVRVIDLFLPRISPVSYAFEAALYGELFFLLCGMLSVGLGIFNLIPIPPLDGSKILFSFFPDRVYAFVLRYERYVMLVLLVIMWIGVLDAPLSFLISRVLKFLCGISGASYRFYQIFFGLA